ncbi:hypothetical protein ACFZDK_26095 [Streptomyces sp. NPDC007901]|uniref:tetratricopeptide repeat protein n=1 Tax=Streptomyces sp. NPDC007901 TaxID=3364785 RepID=UPI0036E47928
MFTQTKVSGRVFAGVRPDEDEHRRTQRQGACGVSDQDVRDAARKELHKKLTDGLARARLTKTQLARQANLGRTTVQQAFQIDGPLASPETIAALAPLLRLSEVQLQDLRRTAADEAAPVAREEGPGKPIREWNPHDLEIHPSGTVPGEWISGQIPMRMMPGYVQREHDRTLAEAVQDAVKGNSRIVVLVGSSSTGKTRACWEAVQPLAHEGWRLWHPFDPTRAEAALVDLERVQRYTVVWLNEAQHYLGDRLVGERVAAAVHSLLTRSRGPVLVLGTLWPEYASQYLTLPEVGESDPYSRVRELLAGCTVTIPETFDQAALRKASDLARGGDQLLADALARAQTDGRVTQDLAGAPELLRRYEHATPAARAMLEAAMDARRLGVGLHLPQSFLTDAAIDYLSDHDYDQLGHDWAEAAFAELARPVHGKQAPLRRTGTRPKRRPPGSQNPDVSQPPASGPMFRVADYLEQHGRATRRIVCPPASFWYAAHAQLTQAQDLHNLARAAEVRHRLQWAHHLWHRAADAGSISALQRVSEIRERAGDPQGAEAMAWRAAKAGHIETLVNLAWVREQAGDGDGAEVIVWRAVDGGHTNVLMGLAQTHEEAGNHKRAEVLHRRAAAAGNAHALSNLARLRMQAGAYAEAETFAQEAADAGHTDALVDLARIHEHEGDLELAEVLYHRAANAGNSRVLADLAWLRDEAADSEAAERFAQQATDAGDTTILFALAQRREEAGDYKGAEAMAKRAVAAGQQDTFILLGGMVEHAGNLNRAVHLYAMAVDAGNSRAAIDLARICEKSGADEQSETLYRLAAELGHTLALVSLVRLRERAGDHEGAEELAQKAADAGHADGLMNVAVKRELSGDTERAEALYRQAAAAGHTLALVNLVELRKTSGDHEGAEELAQKAADAGHAAELVGLARKWIKSGDKERAKALYRVAAEAGDHTALSAVSQLSEQAGDFDRAEETAQKAADAKRLLALAQIRERSGDTERAEALYREAARAGSIMAMTHLLQGVTETGDRDDAQLVAQLAFKSLFFDDLVRMQEEVGNHHGVEFLYGQAIDAGEIWRVPRAHERWPHGLDPDGTPTSPWQ